MGIVDNNVALVLEVFVTLTDNAWSMRFRFILNPGSIAHLSNGSFLGFFLVANFFCDLVRFMGRFSG